MKRASSILFTTLLLGTTLYAQTPAAPAPTNPAPPSQPPAAAPKPAPSAPAASAASVGSPAGASKIAVIDFERAVTGTAEGKKAAEQFQGEITKRQNGMQAKNKEGQDIQTKLQTQDKVLSDQQKAEYTKKLESLQTELTRENEDAQRELGDMQQKLFAPIAQRVQQAIKDYATENGFGVVLDTSSQSNNIMHWSDVADITTEIIRRVDATAPKISAPAAGVPKTTPPAGVRPAGAPATPPKPPAPSADAAKKPNP
jgi:outer membrane protein